MPGPKPIEFPRLGVVRRLANRTEGYRDGYPTPWAMNVRLEDTLTHRLRGGSFKGQGSRVVAENEPGDTWAVLPNPFTNGQPLQLTTTGTLPSPFELLTTYYVVESESDRFKLAATPSGTFIPIAGVGAGTHTATPIFAKPTPVYRDRVITFSDNAITAARQGDSTDTDLDADVSDVARPILFQLAEAGSIGGNVVAVAPHKDAYLLCFTATETWVLSGDPATGTLRRVHDQVGIVGASAWCVAGDTIYFLSPLGLYQVQADGGGLKAVSEDRIPEELADTEDADAILTYYHPDNGVYIHLTASPSWFYDTDRQGFWPFDTSETDSHVLIGPLRLGSVDSFGLIQTLHGIIATGSDPVTWAIVPGATAEAAATAGKAAITAALAGTSYASFVATSGTWTAGRSYTERPRVTAMWCVLWLSCAGDWAFEGITMNTVPAGFWR